MLLGKNMKYIMIVFVILLVACIILWVIDKNAVSEEIETYSPSNTITSLDIRTGAAELNIKASDTFRIESNLKNLNIIEKDGTLILMDNTKLGIANTDAMLTLYIPAETVFEKATIATGAGMFVVEELSAERLYLKLGAGEAIIFSLSATTSARIDGGVGNLTIVDGTLHNLNLNMGVGQCHLTAAVLGNSNCNMGVGQAHLTLLGPEQEYGIQIEKGLGKITVSGEEVTEYTTDGENTFDITGGIGKLYLSFKEVAEG